jgi:YidC/Oxa1 family membrane protein insertase
MSFPPLDAAAGVAYEFLAWLAAALAPIDGGAAVTLAIVLLTALVRLTLLPLSMRRAVAQRAQAALAPKLRELQKKHRGDRERLGAELATLYRDAGTTPLAGMLPTLLQAPAFMVLYHVFAWSGGDLLAAELFGYQLGAHGFAAGWPLLALVGALAAVATVVARRAFLARQPKWTLVLPYLTVIPAVLVPLAAGIYLLTSTTWSAVETAVLGRSTTQSSARTGG